MTELKGVILDWGRTLYDAEGTQDLFPETEEVVKYLAGKYKLAVVSISKRAPSIEAKIQKIKTSKVGKYFQGIFADPDSKDHLFPQAVEVLQLKTEEIAVVGDRIAREIKWGNQHGCLTIWLRKGKFAEEMPNDETDQPNHTITNLVDVKKFL